MAGFFFVWGVAFIGAFIAMPDGDSCESWLARALRAAGYSFVFCIFAIFLGKLLGVSGGDGLDIYYRR